MQTNFFKPSHLKIISQATHENILGPLFEYYLPILFNIPTVHYGISNQKLANFPSITYQDFHDRNEWFEELKRMQRNTQLNNIDMIREYFSNIYMSLWKRSTKQELQTVKQVVKDVQKINNFVIYMVYAINISV
ncbi:hypothetical protein F8M41_015258 [Gigaspora margarita]|uniref:Uncharacterized protein n=1 Tax=Gigaspora margarita TaxID=4874 RepID=A0A8H3WWP4_GIGMA|nr:hypothetical protein F8M41_015258 [Gigaspora margarita]